MGVKPRTSFHTWLLVQNTFLAFQLQQRRATKKTRDKGLGREWSWQNCSEERTSEIAFLSLGLYAFIFFFFARLTPWAHAKQMLYPWELPLSYPTPNSAFILWTHSFRELPSLGPWQSYNSEMPPFSVVQSRTLVRAGDNFYLSN